MMTDLIKVGITGQAGFVGTHLYNQLGLLSKQFERIPFEDSFFYDETKLDKFVADCDAIVHLAAVNRCPDPDDLYNTNIALVEKLICSIKKTQVKPHVLFSSSTQESLDNPYGKSKLKGREMFEEWAKSSGASFSGLVVPNVFGPFCKPNYNSFIATFSWKLTHSENPVVLNDSSVKLIYVDSLCKIIIERISKKQPGIESVEVPHDFEEKVSSILDKMVVYKDQYLLNGIIPAMNDFNEVNLFNTFRSYIDNDVFFPRPLVLNSDERGTFVETIRLGVGGQVSFSTTKPAVTRGNHFHTRKVERFTVIKGKAKIRIRKIGTDSVLDFYLDGNSPSYVDMPVWYTHNIENIGTEELYTQFWINEWYNQDDPDTYFENV